MKKIASVIGPSEISSSEYKRVEKIGEILAVNNYIVATGGLLGVMEATLKGAKTRSGLTIGVVPHIEKKANPYVDICINTGLGTVRNYLLVTIADIVVCTGLSKGTWTELTMALNIGKKTIFLGKEKIPFDNVIKIKELDEFEKYIKDLVPEKI